jgi:putative methyltransferase
MTKTIYIAQFGTGTNINLMPLAAGQLVARLKQETDLLAVHPVGDILFRREKPEKTVQKMREAFIVGFSCFLWNLNISLETAREVKKRFPDALTVLGGPSIPKQRGLCKDFFGMHPYIDVICKGEGEEVFAALCRKQASGEGFEDIPGIIYRAGKGNGISETTLEELPVMKNLPSPYLDGTFDGFYRAHGDAFSGIIWETNRGCPFDCAYCTWGNLPSRIIREKPMKQVMGEIEWIGKNHIKYIAMTDANFGIRKRDIRVAELLAKCKREYGCPDFIGVSWAKTSPDHVLQIAKILREGNVGFRITQALQSFNPYALHAVKRKNTDERVFRQIKQTYYEEHYYTYTELILGLPMESYDSYMDGIERALSDSIYEQVYVYPLFLFPNTQIASPEYREKYHIESKVVPLRYTKSKVSDTEGVIEEFVEIVVGNSTMPGRKWVDAFVIGYYTLALHDDRLAFFILHYLKRKYGFRITSFMDYARKACLLHPMPTIDHAFARLEKCACAVQSHGATNLLEPEPFGGIPYEPPQAIFLELLMDREGFYDDFQGCVEKYLNAQGVAFDAVELRDLFVFQRRIMAHPDGPEDEGALELNYNWIEFFAPAFHQNGRDLRREKRHYRVVDPRPSNGDPSAFLKNHFDIRGIPPFNNLYDDADCLVFPPVSEDGKQK